MPIAKIQLPDGRTAKFEVPEGTTQDQVMEFANKQFGSPQPTPVKNTIDPTEGMSGTQKFLAGTGKAFVDIGRGAGQLLGLVNQKDIDEAKKLDEPLMKTGAGTAGNIVGNVATYAPLALVPGANTIAGGATIGALTGAIQPVGSSDSRLANIGMGGVAGGVVPAAFTAGRTVKAALVDPFTEAGRNRIAGALLNKVAENPQEAAKRMMTVQGATPGFLPSAGQSSDDAGIASLERTIRATYPQGFGELDKSQRGALIDALRSVAKTPEERAAAVASRESAVNPLYDQAKNATVTGDSTIDELLKRPSMQAATGRAVNIAQERGGNFSMPKAQPEKTIQGMILDAQGNPVATQVPYKPAQYQGQTLHDLKMGLDDAIGTPAMGMQGAERAAAIGTKNEYLNWLEKKIPAYAQAKTTFADMSKPINQMDIGTELYNRFIPALADQGGIPFKSTAQSYANALRNADKLAQNVTGMKGASFYKIMTPEQISLLQGVAKDAAMKASSENLGRNVGSDTVQKIAMSNIAAQAGIPNWMQNAARLPGGWIKRAGDVVYGSADEQVRQRLADILRNPKEAAIAMQKAGVTPSELNQMLKLLPQGAALSLPGMIGSQ